MREDDLIGTVALERYRIEERLGAGAMGCVYRARHTRLAREVAIKTLRPELVRNPQVVERFEREARIAARLRHPNLVGVLDVGEHVMVMELAPGRALAELTGAPLPRARVVGLVSQLLRGLAHAHAAGLVHRDLKPENILVERHADASETARIVDFGIAVLRDRDATTPDGRRLTEAGLVVGTPLYMSPEQATGKPVDHRTDLFSLGVIVYELLAGVPPFDGTAAEVAYANVTHDPPLIADRVRGVAVDPLLEAFARRLMARRLDDRFASAHDALAALELIDRDREAAARRLGLFGGPPEAPPAVLRLPRGSDALATLPMDDTDRHAALRDGDPGLDTTDHVRRHAGRCRGMVAAAAAAVLLLIAGWALVRGEPAAGRTSHAALTAPAAPAEAHAPVAQVPVAQVAPVPVAPFAQVAPVPVVPTARIARRTTRVSPIVAPARIAAPARSAAPVRVAAPPAVPAAERRALMPAAALAPVATPQAEVAARPAVADDSAVALAARYHAVGTALHARGTDELWQRYRRIQLGDAMATATSRRAALAALDAIERALPARS